MRSQGREDRDLLGYDMISMDIFEEFPTFVSIAHLILYFHFAPRLLSAGTFTFC